MTLNMAILEGAGLEPKMSRPAMLQAAQMDGANSDAQILCRVKLLNVHKSAEYFRRTTKNTVDLGAKAQLP